MKISIKKSLIFTAFAATVLAAVLAIGCTSPVDGSLGGGWGDEPTLPGTGKVKLSINSRNYSRTILPTALPANTKYYVTFDDTSTTISPYSTTINTSGTVIIPSIPAGNYDKISVIVYTSATNLNGTAVENAAIGEGSVTGTFNVTGGLDDFSSSAITTALYAPGSKTGNGTFVYNLDMKNITNLTAASFDIVPRPTGTSLGTTNINIIDYDTAAVTGSVNNIPAGYYNVLFTLTNSTSDKAYFYQILHVYKNMTSPFTFNGFSDALFPTPGPSIGGMITIQDPDLPDDIEYTLTNVTNATVTNSTNGGFLVQVTDGNTATIRLSITTTVSGTATLTIDDWKYGLAGSLPPSALSIGTTTVDLTINTATPPFTGKPTFITTVEFTYNSVPYSAVPITISIN